MPVFHLSGGSVTRGSGCLLLSIWRGGGAHVFNVYSTFGLGSKIEYQNKRQFIVSGGVMNTGGDLGRF